MIPHSSMHLCFQNGGSHCHWRLRCDRMPTCLSWGLLLLVDWLRSSKRAGQRSGVSCFTITALSWESEWRTVWLQRNTREELNPQASTPHSHAHWVWLCVVMPRFALHKKIRSNMAGYVINSLWFLGEGLQHHHLEAVDIQCKMLMTLKRVFMINTVVGQYTERLMGLPFSVIRAYLLPVLLHSHPQHHCSWLANLIKVWSITLSQCLWHPRDYGI